MKILTNTGRKPIKLRLPGGKTLFLGGMKAAQVRDTALEHPPIKKLLESGQLKASESIYDERVTGNKSFAKRDTFGSNATD